MSPILQHRVVEAVLIAAVLWLGSWVWRVEKQIDRGNTQDRINTYFWKLQAQNWKAINELNKAFGKDPLPWPEPNWEAP